MVKGYGMVCMEGQSWLMNMLLLNKEWLAIIPLFLQRGSEWIERETSLLISPQYLKCRTLLGTNWTTMDAS